VTFDPFGDFATAAGSISCSSERAISRHCEEAIRTFRVALDCFAEPVIGRAFARPVGSQ
jgi:hypothetical protein